MNKSILVSNRLMQHFSHSYRQQVGV